MINDNLITSMLGSLFGNNIPGVNQYIQQTNTNARTSDIENNSDIQSLLQNGPLMAKLSAEEKKKVEQAHTSVKKAAENLFKKIDEASKPLMEEKENQPSELPSIATQDPNNLPLSKNPTLYSQNLVDKSLSQNPNWLVNDNRTTLARGLLGMNIHEQSDPNAVLKLLNSAAEDDAKTKLDTAGYYSQLPGELGKLDKQKQYMMEMEKMRLRGKQMIPGSHIVEKKLPSGQTVAVWVDANGNELDSIGSTYVPISGREGLDTHQTENNMDQESYKNDSKAVQEHFDTITKTKNSIPMFNRLLSSAQKTPSGYVVGHPVIQGLMRTFGISDKEIEETLQQNKQATFDMLGGKLGAQISDADREFIAGLLWDSRNGQDVNVSTIKNHINGLYRKAANSAQVLDDAQTRWGTSGRNIMPLGYKRDNYAEVIPNSFTKSGSPVFKDSKGLYIIGENGQKLYKR